jgi:AFG3 family protein
MLSILCCAGVEPRPKFYFLIGSVDSFERKLDDAQKELGLDSAAHVPVKYSREVTNDTTSILYLAPSYLV